MLRVFLIISLIFSLPVFSNIEKAMEMFKKNNGLSEHEEMTYVLFESGHYYSAAFFAKRHLIKAKTISPAFEQVLERIVQKTGSDTFADFPTEILSRHTKEAPTLAFTLGQRFFKERKFDEALKELAHIPNDHRFFVESRLVRAGIFTLRGDYKQSLLNYQECIHEADRQAKKSEQEKHKRYYMIMSQQCLSATARIEYAKGKFVESLEGYEKIEKRSYLWPSLLLEKAWGHYALQDYNRTLGLLVTYKSPLLDGYFFPEAEVLAALSYYRLCLWDDALTVVEHFYKNYAPKSDELKKIIENQKQSHDWFYEVAFYDKEKLKALGPYMPQMITQIRKSVKFSLDLIGIRKAEQEISELEKLPKGLFKILLMTEVSEAKSYHIRQLNHFIKEQMFALVNQINKLSYEMFNLKLEIISNKRDLLYKNQKLAAERGRGDISNVKRSSNQYFWDFKGEFWADELGEYSFGLQSNCEVVGAAPTSANP